MQEGALSREPPHIKGNMKKGIALLAAVIALLMVLPTRADGDRRGDVTRLDLMATVCTPVTLTLNQGWNLFPTPVARDASGDTWGKLVRLGDGLNLDPQAITYYFDSLSQSWNEVRADYQIKPCDAIHVKSVGFNQTPY